MSIRSDVARAEAAAPTTIPEGLHEVGRSGMAGLVFHLEEGMERLSADDLERSAEQGAAGLHHLGVRPGDAVGILGPNRPIWPRLAFAIWRLGAAVVPIGFPFRVRDRDALAEQVDRVIGVAACRLVLTEESMLDVVPGELVAPWDQPWRGDHTAPAAGPGPVAENAAVIQFTSGSTAKPKGVVITHSAALASIRAMELGMGVRSGVDRYFAWLPFFHDNGLFGCLLRPLFHGCEGHVLPTERFVRDPVLWFRLLSRTGATITTAPSSAWAAAIRAVQDPEGLDLSSLRLAILGAEMIDPAVVDRLVQFGARIGLSAGALTGVYGMAEATLGVTITPPGEGIRIDRAGLQELAGGHAGSSPDSREKRVASCGRPYPGFDVAIGSPSDPLAERRVGEIFVRGPSLMRGYIGTSEPDPFVDGWLATGDLGYVAEGELFITGRIKEVIIALGRNYAPEDIEWAAMRVPGVRPGRCVAFGRPGGQEGEVVVVVEARPEADVETLPALVRSAVADAVGLTPREVLVVTAGTVPKTTSGKLRRSALRSAYAEGRLQEAGLGDAP